MNSDATEGKSECMILGQSMRIGTGAFMVARRLTIGPRDLVAKRIAFENLT